MTEVEAIERILKGEPFKGCMHCDGMGTTPASRERYKRAVAEYEYLQNSSIPPKRVPPNVKDYSQLCMRCNGVGQVVEDTYAEACKVLGRDLPKPQMDYFTVMKGIQQKVAERANELLQKYVVKNDP